MDSAKKAASDVAEVGKEIEQKLILLWDELAPWQQDNHYIQSGYRAQSNSYSKSWKSLGYLHNETVNIYSHLIGALLAAVSGVVVYRELAPRYDTATQEDVFVFICFFAGAIACMGMSGTYHTIQNHSHEVAKWGNKLDYLGIVFLIWGSFIPVLYYAFGEEPELRRTYWAMITTLAAGTSIVCTHPKFRTPALRPFRALMFVLMGLSAVFPVLHGIRLYGVEQLRKSIGLDWVVLQGVLYIAGAALYAARVPEKWSPGTFDIWGSSHQIFHVLVVLAAASHLVGLVKAFDYEHSRRIGGVRAATGTKAWW
ncbi:HlyIII-domain-containing protein [Cucurbitaria berberidis CBS 394.84]|uniref:HlyIII-domain-containing protein n=1 Tax=Cucurbitaria berberidis CBS 394.84 TaxID=1168544 RepID=A0A9P4GAY3_9PLEO|nr:HlyIII-domain-containing protein [Cucurbitaria berberidis CBS 394.84]KAF1842221.1 HlyIII-domain-containing protein [Cucurbitaria berberidis CBS 394.84]